MWMKLKAAANRNLEDIFALFLKLFAVILTYQSGRGGNLFLVKVQERCGRRARRE